MDVGRAITDAMQAQERKDWRKMAYVRLRAIEDGQAADARRLNELIERLGRCLPAAS